MHRATLEQNGIFLEEEPAHSGKTPPHVNRLRDALLDFDCTLADRLALEEETDIRDVQAILRDLEVSESERADSEHFLAECGKKRDKAQSLHDGKDREPEWQRYFLNDFLQPLAEEMKISDKDLRRYVPGNFAHDWLIAKGIARISRMKFYYDYFK